jgi:hypothetical protein
MQTKFAILIAFPALVVGFGGGYVVGRQPHHYVRLGNQGVLMYDETTGHICNGMKKTVVNRVDAAIENNLPQGFVLDEKAKQSSETASDDPWAARAKQLEGGSPELPHCGEE